MINEDCRNQQRVIKMEEKLFDANWRRKTPPQTPLMAIIDRVMCSGFLLVCCAYWNKSTVTVTLRGGLFRQFQLNWFINWQEVLSLFSSNFVKIIIGFVEI